MKSKIVDSVIILYGLWLDVEGELGAEQVPVVDILPVWDLGTGYTMVSDFSWPVVGDFLKDRLDGSEIHARVTFNIGIESMLDIVEGLNVVVRNINR